jgi:UPF0755 protein
VTFDDRDAGAPTGAPDHFDDDIWTDAGAAAPAPGEVGAAPVAPSSARSSGAARRGPRRPRADRSRPPERRRRPSEDDEYVELPPESRVPRWLVALLVVGALVVGVVGGARWWYGNQLDPPGGPGAEVAIEIPVGTSANRAAEILAESGVITNSTLFNFWVGGKELATVQAGSYTFREDLSFDEALEVLNAGPETPVAAEVTSVTVAEGLTVPEIVASINEDVPRFSIADLDAALSAGEVPSALQPDDVASYEGLLFPATYEIGDEDNGLELLRMMAAEMEVRTAELGIDEAAARLSAETGQQLDAYDLLVIASLIQEEAGSAEEAPRIARVIYNRLADGWALGIDATSRYLAELEGTEVDFESTSPFNTRRQAGIPPTPIAAPGEFAIEAAISPAEGPWFYYVLTDPGVHTFAVTDAEFQEAKQICIAKDLGCG